MMLGFYYMVQIVHHHLIYQAQVGRNDLDEHAEAELKKFLYDLLEEIGMQELIPAQLKFSHQKAWTGIIGIVTSHISFHYWTVEKYIQLDIYSCKPFNKAKTVKYLDKFWLGTNTKTLFIDRKIGGKFEIVEHIA